MGQTSNSKLIIVESGLSKGWQDIEYFNISLSPIWTGETFTELCSWGDTGLTAECEWTAASGLAIPDYYVISAITTRS